MKHLNYQTIATLPNMIWVWANGCGLELDARAIE